MAKIIMGAATSHSPQLSTPVDKWHLHVERDERNKKLYFRGKKYSYDELVELRKPEHLENEVSEEKWNQKYEQWERRIVEIQDRLAKVSPDVIVVLGDDQRELFLDDNMPTFSVFWGEQAELIPPPPRHPSIEQARWANSGYETEFFTCEPELGHHIIETMMVEGFDVAQLKRQPEGRSIGHSINFTKHRLMKDGLDIPMVPVMLNTYFPPNQPTAARCYAFGQALRKAIESWDSDKKVAVLASGGLSHFVVDEKIDKIVIEGFKNDDVTRFTSIPEDEYCSGTSEIKNWIAAAGAMQHLDMELIDYIPAYRSLAGTGCGMGFAWWE